MATYDPTKPWLEEGYTLSSNPFYANQQYFGSNSALPEYYQQNGIWYQNQPYNYNMGDTDMTGYNAVAMGEDFDPTTLTYFQESGDNGGFERNMDMRYNYGVNFDQVPEEFRSNWETRDSGGFLRDSMGYTQFEVIGYDPETGVYITRSKVGDKEGLVQAWAPTEDGGMQVVANLGTENWDTNKDVVEQGSFKVLPSLVAGWVAPAIAAANGITLGANVAGNAIAGAGELASMGPEFATLGGNVAGTVTAGAAAAGSTIGTADGLVNAGNGLTPGAGVNAGAWSASAAGTQAVLQQYGPQALTAATTLAETAGPPTIEEIIQAGTDAVKRVINSPAGQAVELIWTGTKWVVGTVGTINTISRLTTGKNLINLPGPSGGPTNSNPPPGGPNVTTNNTGGGYDDLLNFFLNMAGQGVTSDRLENVDDNLQSWYNDAMAKVGPIEQQLNDSYTPEGQNRILTSPEFMNAQSVYKQGIDRVAAQQGALTNPMSGLQKRPDAARGREAALQKYGLDYLKDYRKPLQDRLDMYLRNAGNYAGLSAMAQYNEAGLPSQWAQQLARYRGQNGQYSFSSMWKDVQRLGGDISKFWDWITGKDDGGWDYSLQDEGRITDPEGNIWVEGSNGGWEILENSNDWEAGSAGWDFSQQDEGLIYGPDDTIWGVDSNGDWVPLTGGGED